MQLYRTRSGQIGIAFDVGICGGLHQAKRHRTRTGKPAR